MAVNLDTFNYVKREIDDAQERFTNYRIALSSGRPIRLRHSSLIDRCFVDLRMPEECEAFDRLFRDINRDHYGADQTTYHRVVTAAYQFEKCERRWVPHFLAAGFDRSCAKLGWPNDNFLFRWSLANREIVGMSDPESLRAAYKAKTVAILVNVVAVAFKRVRKKGFLCRRPNHAAWRADLASEREERRVFAARREVAHEALNLRGIR